MWNRIKKLFQRGPAPGGKVARGSSQGPVGEMGFQAPRPDLAGKEPAWIAATDNPFGVRVLDVRPITLGTLSASSDPRMAQNAVSYGGEDGSSFAAVRPASARRVAVSLRYPAPEHLVDGALFIPQEMEDKWALFIQAQTLVLVRSWRREVLLRAPLRLEGEWVYVGPLEGFVYAEDEPEAYTRRAVDFIVRTHALRAPWPAPLLGSEADPPRGLAVQTMSMFGRNALYAAFDEPDAKVLTNRLRVVHRLHMATLRGDLEGVRAALSGGVPVHLRDRFGRCAIHYVKEVGPLLSLLREHGALLDERGDEGDTLLMLAVQDRQRDLATALLGQGASASAADCRGFTALHRAAEMGEIEIARALLAHGADPDAAATGDHTPRSLATQRKEAGVLALFAAPQVR